MCIIWELKNQSLSPCILLSMLKKYVLHLLVAGHLR